MSDPATFDYEAALWGADEIGPDERSIAAFRLREILAGLPERGRVLEVGCGGGRYLRALARLRGGLELVGCDASRAALARCSELAPAIATHPVDGRRLPFDDACFDAVLAVDVLEHLDDPAGTLAEVHRVLAPGGSFHLHLPCEGDALSLWSWLPGQRGEAALKRRFGGHVQRFRRREVFELLAAAGLRVDRVRNSLHFFGNLADVAAFLQLARRNRSAESPLTTGDLMASAGPLVRAVDRLLWYEALALSRIPSWSMHLWCRKIDL